MSVERQDTAELLLNREQAEEHVRANCFTLAEPQLTGVEIEWLVYHKDHCARPVQLAELSTALGEYAPQTVSLNSPHHALPNGSVLTIEPGGQVEISTPPQRSVPHLIATTSADIGVLVELLRNAGLRLGQYAIDAHRAPRLMLEIPRYQAMEIAYARYGSAAGHTMMCSTAGLQICIDAGKPEQIVDRWAAAHALGPLMIAAFANSAEFGGRHTGWKSTRMRMLYQMDPKRTGPAQVCADPASSWARRALDTPLLCVRRSTGSWEAPPGVTFADWINGALDIRPTLSDLDYHLSTIFPPVRPRGYLEIRYLDTQPTGEWVVPVLLITALFHDESTIDRVLDIVSPVAQRWLAAARHGLADPALGMVAPVVFDLALRKLPALGIPATTIALAQETVEYVLAGRSPLGAGQYSG